jgi:hypothetical protein
MPVHGGLPRDMPKGPAKHRFAGPFIPGLGRREPWRLIERACVALLL